MLLIIDKLKTYKDFTDTEKIIADYITSLGYELENKSTRWIAEKTYTSSASVVRLSQKLRFEGFDDFKAQYIKELKYIETQFGTVNVNFPFSKGDNIMKVASNIGSLHHEVIDDTLALQTFNSLHKTNELITKSESIYIFSLGTALSQAESFKERMQKIGKRIIISTNLNYQMYEVSCISKKDVAIIISYSGETEKALLIADILTKKKIPIIAITSLGENSLRKKADISIDMSTKESMFNNIADFSSHLSVNLILDIMYSVYFQRDYEKNYKHKQKYINIMEKNRTSTNTILMND